MPPALEVWTLNHWPTRVNHFYNLSFDIRVCLWLLPRPSPFSCQSPHLSLWLSAFPLLDWASLVPLSIWNSPAQVQSQPSTSQQRVANASSWSAFTPLYVFRFYFQPLLSMNFQGSCFLPLFTFSLPFFFFEMSQLQFSNLSLLSVPN